jgi:hypothetical protein
MRKAGRIVALVAGIVSTIAAVAMLLFIIEAASLGKAWADPKEDLPATGVTSGSIIGEDGNPAFGNPLRYEDNGDGTITDKNTGTDVGEEGGV